MLWKNGLSSQFNMINLNDYIWSPNGKSRNKLYKLICANCLKDKGYGQKRFSERLCRNCANSTSEIKNLRREMKSKNFTSKGRKMTEKNKKLLVEKISGKNHYNWKGGVPTCIDCGKTIYYNQKRCKSCYNKTQFGKTNPNYKGDKCITIISKLIRGDKKYKDWTKLCMKRDNYTCQFTGIRGGKLNVHHKIPLSDIISEVKTITIDHNEIIKKVLELHTLDLGITVNEDYHLKIIHGVKS